MLCGKKIEGSLLKTKEESKDWMDSSLQLQASEPPAAVALFCSLFGSYSQFSPDGAVMQDCGGWHVELIDCCGGLFFELPLNVSVSFVFQGTPRPQDKSDRRIW